MVCGTRLGLFAPENMFSVVMIPQLNASIRVYLLSKNTLLDSPLLQKSISVLLSNYTLIAYK